MTNMQVIYYNKDPDDFLVSLGQSLIKDLPSSVEYKLESEYRSAISGSEFTDLSFCVKQNGEVVLFCFCHKINSHAVYYGSGARFFILDESNKKLICQALDLLIEHALSFGVELLEINDVCNHSFLSLLGTECLNRKAFPETIIVASIDLNDDEETIHKNIRRRYKSMINRGKRDLSFFFYNYQNIDRDIFSQFQKFHHEVSGRLTRTRESWDVQYEMVKQNCGEIIMGALPGYGVVSAALYLDHGAVTFYGVAVYNRDLFGIPLAHANVYQGIIRAKKRNKKTFSFGPIKPYSLEEEKVYNIGKFKKGFCNELSPLIKWKLPLKTEE